MALVFYFQDVDQPEPSNDKLSKFKLLITTFLQKVSQQSTPNTLASGATKRALGNKRNKAEVAALVGKIEGIVSMLHEHKII